MDRRILVCLVGGCALFGALAFGCASDSSDDARVEPSPASSSTSTRASPTPGGPAAPTPVDPATQPPIVGRQRVARDQETLGDPALDDLLRRIEAHDVTYVSERIEHVPLMCASRDVTSCRASQERLLLLRVSGCRGTPGDYVLQDPVEIDAVLDAALPAGARSSLFWAHQASRSPSKGSRGPDAYAVGLSAGPAPDAAAPQTHWGIATTGFIFSVGCAPAAPPVAAEPAALISPYLIPPGGSCVEGDTQTFYEVRAAEYAGVGRGMFAASEYASDGSSIDLNAFVWVPGKSTNGLVYTRGPNRSPDEVGGAAYGGALRSFGDVKAGMRLNVRGWRFADCQLEAWLIEPAP